MIGGQQRSEGPVVVERLEDQAMDLLVKQSQHENIKLREIAREVVAHASRMN